VAAIKISQKSDSLTNVDRATGIFDEYGDFIRSIIRFHVKNESKAEDLFQDLFLSLVAKPIPEEVRNIKGFLYKLISDMIKDAFRRMDRYQARMRRYAERNLRVAENRPETGLIDVEETNKMFGLIERHLSVKEALAVKLRFKDNCDTGETAEIMGVKPRSVSRYVSIGLKRVSHAIEKKREGNYDKC
jgi:RNA polymerase sigma factor (sigma-70 family)